jgi:glutaredoxin
METETEFILPNSSEFTIYSKSGCPNCIKVKNFLLEKGLKYAVVDCDDYIIENRSKFLFFMSEKTNSENNVFPFVFYNGMYIGSYKETVNYGDKLSITFDFE